MQKQGISIVQHTIVRNAQMQHKHNSALVSRELDFLSCNLLFYYNIVLMLVITSPQYGKQLQQHT